MALLAFFCTFVATLLLPGPVTAVLAVNMLAVLSLSALHVWIAFLPRFAPPQCSSSSRAFVSIIVPAYNEPPALLMSTLEALSRLRYDRYEVLVIDNNAEDPNVWQPVQAFTATLGERFRYVHVEGLRGFKAGALNFILPQVSPETRYVAVIDADYVVQSNFLTLALAYFTDHAIGLVQFPQDYRNCTPRSRPIADEYRHFFKIYMNMANHLDCVPSTGTVSIFRLAALRAIEGFREDALTEDADAGLRMHRAGFRGVYVDRVVGVGLMPYDIEAYRKQKRRWALGNAQALRTLISLYGRIPLRSWIGFVGHLTAWDHLNFLPFAVIAAYVIVASPAVETTAAHKLLLDVASICVFATVLSKAIVFLATFRDQKSWCRRSIQAFLVHMGMTLVYSEAWLMLLLRKRLTFERTDKFVLTTVPNVLKSSYCELMLGVWFALGAVGACAFGARVITIVAFVISSLVLLSIYYVHWSIGPTKARSKELLSILERRYAAHLRGDASTVSTANS